jgi:WD40 repeat protein
VFQVNFSPDSSRIIIANADGVCPILDVETAKPLLPPLKHKNNIFTAVYSADGARILTASADRTARIWDAATGKPLGPIFHHGYWIWMAAFNKDSTRVVTASWDHTARVWDAYSGTPVTPPLQHADAVTWAVFSPDGKLAATASRDHTARVWDAETGDPLTLPIRAGGEVTAAIFNPAGTSLLVTAKDGTAAVYDMPPPEAAPPWLADLADFASTQISYDTLREPDMGEIAALRAKLLASKSGDPWAKFGRWYFAEPDARCISPWSTLTLKEYVDELTAAGDRDSLDYAISLSKNIPAWMVKLVPLREKLGPAAPPASAVKDND